MRGPEEILGKVEREAEPVEVNVYQDDARLLLVYSEVHVERLIEDQAEARTEMGGVRYEAESLLVDRPGWA